MIGEGEWPRWGWVSDEEMERVIEEEAREFELECRESQWWAERQRFLEDLAEKEEEWNEGD
jgi:hypothetical protein